MKKRLLIFLAGFFSLAFTFAQSTLIKGSVKDAATNEPLPEVTITIEETGQQTQTDAKGEFVFSQNVPLGEQVLRVSKNGYLTKRYPIVVNEGGIVDITDMILDIDVADTVDLFTITLSDDELNDDTSGLDNISGLLQSSQDVFQRTAAFEFSSSFFRVRGLDSENGSVLINGIEMNKIYDGRPQWSDWGGLNDVLRNQELTTGLKPSNYNFGGILGTTNMNVRASSYRSGGRVTYSTSNRSYTNRVMASYASGELDGGWSFAFMAGRRWGKEGYQEGTLYDANSFFASIEKKLGDKHALNFTSMYTPNRRGKSSPNTQEVYDLKDIKYNEYWGYLDGEKKNSRIKEIEEPIFMLNHYWDISSKTKLNTNVGYQFGKIGNSRLDYAGGANPSPAYYQKLPSYFLSDPDGPDYAGAYVAEQEFINNGQIDWERIIDANVTNNTSGEYAAYALYEDRNDDQLFTVNSILNSEISENILLNASFTYKKLKSENFGEILDMLGSSTGYLNVDSFDGFQYDYRNPDQVLGVGDKYRYHYNLFADVISGYAQAQFKYSKVDFYLSGSVTSTNYEREGLFQNEANIQLDADGNVVFDNSYGKGGDLSFTGVGAKAGMTYKISGKHLIDVNGGYLTKAPTLRNSYTNSRSNHDVVGVTNGRDVAEAGDITEEEVLSVDASYIFRSPIVQAKLTGYYTTIKNANETSFYYADGVYGFQQDDVVQSNEFISEVLQGIDKRHMGVEFGIEAQVLATLKLKGVASVGEYVYTNNPNLYLTADSRSAEFGKAYLKDYKVAGGPQQAYSVGFEYRDPDYWWFGATVNYFNATYVDISPLTRTRNFYLDNDGLPFNDFDASIAEELLKQEKFDDYFTVNLIGGKSWKINNYYIGLFASVNNLLDEVYKTGGFEQGRNANYRELRDDVNNPKRVFGAKYWYGRGATYFMNLNFRF